MIASCPGTITCQTGCCQHLPSLQCPEDFPSHKAPLSWGILWLMKWILTSVPMITDSCSSPAPFSSIWLDECMLRKPQQPNHLNISTKEMGDTSLVI